MQTFLNSILLPIITAAGGTAVAVWAIMQFFGKKIVDYFSNRAIEKYKSELSVKNHVSQYRFDKEIESVGTVLGLLYEVSLKAEYLRQNNRHINEYEYQHVYNQCDDKAREFAATYFKNCLYINSNLTDKFFHIVKLMEEFMNKAATARYNIKQLEEMTGADLSPLGEEERENCQRHYDEANRRMKAIVEEISTGKDYGFYKLVEQAREYVDGLLVI